MKTDLFFCSVATTPLRSFMAETCLARWHLEPDTHLTELRDGGDPGGFQLKRRQLAADMADSPIYILADDDCLPEKPEPFVRDCLEILSHYPEFAVLSLWPSNSTLHSWKADDIPGYTPTVTEDVLEHVSVGGIRFCRKDAFTDLDWPPLQGKTYDSQEAQALRNAGYRVGYFRNFYMNHLGRNYSQVWP